jgi:hypothetical protein
MSESIRDDTPWRRTWTDGRSVLTVYRDIFDGRVFITVADIEKGGFAASFTPATADEIAGFITEGS